MYMQDWQTTLRQAAFSGAAAAVLSAIALGVCGRLEGGSAAGPNNGPSQWIWGRGAAYRRRASLRHTLVGYCVHHLMATGWAVLHERIFGARKHQQTAAQRISRAAATAATANFVDYQLTPLRLRPGFEVQLSKTSLFVVYAAFAVGLTLLHDSPATRRTPRGQR